ncbi:MAG: ASPIC/UnbV domain-containing protein [Proteobacteria bacterium]|nr:ASPIC/UnbV domain-containing protein [Pseudomonadota bacterium]
MGENPTRQPAPAGSNRSNCGGNKAVEACGEACREYGGIVAACYCARCSIVFQLHDEVGNRDGIGTKFTIHYGPRGERHQLRELKAGGGYISFDEPLAHFGLGE